jgi:hypothetical protein
LLSIKFDYINGAVVLEVIYVYPYIYKVEKVFRQHTNKIIKILNSIENEGQLECAKNIISNFVEYWKWKKMDVKEIRNNLATFNMIYKFKRNSFYE